jgi:uncharacterized delta-60 repeat protein
MKKRFIMIFGIPLLFQIILLFAGIRQLHAQAGLIDPTFQVGSGSNQVVNVIEVLPDGKIFMGGDFTNFNATVVKRVVRLHPNGSHDQSFVPYFGTNGVDGPVRSSALQPDGKILVGGLFNTVNGINSKNIVRLDSVGDVDQSFIIGLGANNEVLAIASNGSRIMLSGFFSQYNGIAAPGLVCLHPDGTRDTTFQLPPAWVNISAIHLQPNNQVYLAGNFTSYLGTPVGRIVRLNADGTLDTTFNTGAGFNALIHSMAVQPDGKIVLGGAFATVNGVPRNRMARLNANGTLDTLFNPGTGASGGVRTIALQPDGKIIIAGDFATYNGITVNRIARLLPNGTLDTTYMSGSGTNGTVMSVKVQSDGKVLMGGGFSQVQGAAVYRVTRLLTDLCVGDTIPPVPLLPALPGIAGLCEVTITEAPLATDNCAGTISATTSDPLHYNQPGNYQITWLFDDGNGNFATQIQQVVVAAINTAVLVDTILPGFQYELKSQYGSTTATFQWVDCNNLFAPVSGAVSHAFLPSASGTYAVIISDSICTDTSSCVTVMISNISIENQYSIQDVSVYPNPHHGHFIIESDQPVTSATIIIRNVNGMKTYEYPWQLGNTFAVDLSAMPAGIYFVEIARNTGFVRFKTLKY